MFSLKLLDQYWSNGSRDQDGDPDDLTSHGKISLQINDIEISGCDHKETNYGINQAAVELLKSVFESRISNAEDPLIPHGCDIWVSCPNCIVTFSVNHKDSYIELREFIVSGGPQGLDVGRFKSIRAVIPFSDYAREILSFAKVALSFLPEYKAGDQSEVNEYLSLRRKQEALIFLLESKVLPQGFIDPDNLKEYRAIVQGKIKT